MKNIYFVIREEKLRFDINQEIIKEKPDIENIIKMFYSFEKNNLSFIEKLKRKKIIETKKISGALKNTINAHGPITHSLIGSATKRIWGSLLTTEPIKTNLNKLKHFLTFKWIR